MEVNSPVAQSGKSFEERCYQQYLPDTAGGRVMNMKVSAHLRLQLFALHKAHLYFDSEIKSPSHECHISLNSGWNHLVFGGPYSVQNRLVHQHNKCAKISLQKNGLFEIPWLLANSIPDKQLIGNV